MKPPTSTPIQYAAYIEHVKEVTLFGEADLALWREVLKRENLYPSDTGGKVGILISAPNLLWKGARFCECSVSVAVSERAGGQTNDGYFLAHAFNSLRFFAFAERTFFKTPYYYAGVEVMVRAPIGVRVHHRAETVFEAKMTESRTPARREEERFQGPVYLPGGKNYFTARISGMTDFYPFSASDQLTMKASPERIFQHLLDSNFTPLEWRIREDATHGKSKTYPREKGR